MKQILWGLAFMIVVPAMFGAVLIVPFLLAKAFGIDFVLFYLVLIAVVYCFSMGFCYGPGLEAWLSQKLKDWRAKAS